MSRRPENPGTCAFCGEIITKRGVAKHLDKCAKRQESLLVAEASSRPIETLWRLRVQDAYDKDFWLDLEIVGSASLDKLDKYLRAIWLECCGHLSKFTIGGWGGLDVGKERKADKIKIIWQFSVQAARSMLNSRYVKVQSDNEKFKEI